MRTLYFKESKNLESVQSIGIIPFEKSGTTIVEFNDTKYSVLTGEYVNGKKIEASEIFGYAEVSEKENKKLKVKLEDIKASIDNKVAIEKKQRKREIIGYLKIENGESEEKYIVLVEEKHVLLPVILPLLIVGLLIGGTGLISGIDKTTPVPEPEKTKEEVVFKDGDKGRGEIPKDAVEFGEQPTFRMKLNCTPTIEDGQMNLRLESPAEDNEGLGFVVKVYLLTKIDSQTKDVIETYEDGSEQAMIYESPIIYADENIEMCELDKEVESGLYEARAVYSIYDTENNFLGQVASRLELRAE